MTKIDPDILRSLLRYEPETGKLYWLKRGAEHYQDSRCSAAGQAAQWNAIYAGKEAFSSKSRSGYMKGAILGRHMNAHRVIWALVNGVWPKEIDHINGDKADNRIENLRSVTSSENNKNRRLPACNKSGRIGVFWHARHKCWRAFIGHQGKRIHLGSFQVKDDAIAARKRAEKDFGFHANHGRVA